MPAFTHLHVHTQYSILDGLSKIPDIIKKAKDDEMTALAITDHGNLFGAKIFYNEALKQGIKPIIGCEVYVAPNSRFDKSEKENRKSYHLILLAKNLTGYKNLVKLTSYSYIEGYYYKPRIDFELLEKYHEGLIASTACLGGELPRAILNDNENDAANIINKYKNLFGDDYYLELQRHKSDNSYRTDTYEKQQIVNAKLLEYSKKFDVKYIAANDVHFINAEDAEAHDHLICINTGKLLEDSDRMRYTRQEFLKTREEMSELFHDVPEALENTKEIVDKIEHYELNHNPIMPIFPIPEKFGNENEYHEKFNEESLINEFGETRYNNLGGYDAVLRIKFESDYLKYLVYKGMKVRYGDSPDESIKQRIDFELGVIKNMGFPGYFLIVQDFLNEARKMGVSIGPGRGSAAGSCVAYCTYITDIDPLKYNLLFERFLNPERISMPDIDIDFDEEGREEVLNWVVEKYGYERVAHIITFGKMAPKLSIRDVARVRKISLNESNRLAGLIPEKPGTTFAKAYKEVEQLRKEKESKNKDITNTLKYAESLEGSIRQSGIHACGIIIGRDSLIEHIPLSKHKDAKLLVTQYDGKHIEDVGMLKMDFLGLKTLSIIRDAITIIKQSKKVEIDFNNIPLDDEKTYQLFARGDTTGLFQFESLGMKKYLRELKPNRFDDLIAMNALYRPGPMEHITKYIKRKHGKEKIEYDFPVMEKYLAETYGITVYQEQVMLLSQELAGFTGGQADSLRKAMGKKIKSMMTDLKGKFVEGCKNRGFDEKGVLKIWSDWEKFAEYAFNKSHSTCYAMLAYQTAYLKAHYPAEFMAAVLSRNLSDIKKITILMDECRSTGLEVLGPDINESYFKFTVNKKGNLRFGLGGIKGVGKSAVENIITEREKNGTFSTIFDFVERVNLHAVNKKSIEALAIAGGFDCFPNIRRHQFFCEVKNNGTQFVETLIKYGNKVQDDKQNAQASLFDNVSEIEITKPEIPTCEEWTNLVQLNREKELIGIYVSAHPLDDFRVLIKNFCTHKLSELKDFNKVKGKDVTIAGIVTNSREGRTRKGIIYGSITIEDLTDSYTIALFGDNYINFKNYFVKGFLLLIKGKIKNREWGNKDELEYKINSFLTLPELWDKVKKLTLKISIDAINDSFLNSIDKIVNDNKGKTTLQFLVYDNSENVWIMLFSRSNKISLTDNMITFLEQNPDIEFKLE